MKSTTGTIRIFVRGATRETRPKLKIKIGKVKIWADKVAEIMLFKLCNFSGMNFNEFPKGCANKTIPNMARKESWKPTSHLRIIGFIKIIIVAVNIIILVLLGKRPNFWAKR